MAMKYTVVIPRLEHIVQYGWTDQEILDALNHACIDLQIKKFQNLSGRNNVNISAKDAYVALRRHLGQPKIQSNYLLAELTKPPSYAVQNLTWRFWVTPQQDMILIVAYKRLRDPSVELKVTRYLYRELRRHSVNTPKIKSFLELYQDGAKRLRSSEPSKR